MKKIIFKVFIIVISIGLFYFLASTKNAYADCTANIEFSSPANASFNQPITFTSNVGLGGFDNGGANDGYCSSRVDLSGTRLPAKNLYVYYDFGATINPRSNPPDSLLGSKFKVVKIVLAQNSPTVSAVANLTPSDFGFKSGDTFTINAQVLICPEDTRAVCSRLTASDVRSVQLTAGTYTIYACTSNGKYACSAGGANRSDCSGIPNKSSVCGSSPCVQIDSNLCGQSVPTHKGCINNSCVNVSGAGTDSCTTNPNSCAGAPAASSSKNFEIENPIGVDNFQDLIGTIGTWIFNLAIPIAVIMIIYGGIQMLIGGAQPKQFESGKKTLRYAITGLAVILIGKGFVSLVQSILNLKNR